MEKSDSDLADLQWNGGDSIIIVRNCTAWIAFARVRNYKPLSYNLIISLAVEGVPL